MNAREPWLPTITVRSETCTGCAIRLGNGQQTVCDGSGVICITDYPESRVVVCPEWDCDEPEPLASLEAIADLGYDEMPATMQERIRANTFAEIIDIRQEKRYSRRTKLLVILGSALVGWVLLIGTVYIVAKVVIEAFR